MDEWRVLTEKFLRRAFAQYFSMDFEELSQLELIEDNGLRSLLALAASCAANGSTKESLVLAKFALNLAIQSCIEGPSLSSYGDAYRWEDTHDPIFEDLYYNRSSPDATIQDFVEPVADRVQELADKVALLARGVNLLDFERFVSTAPEIVSEIGVLNRPILDMSREDWKGTGEHFDPSAPSYLAARWGGRPRQPDDAKWAVQFVIGAIVQLQSAQRPPRVWSSDFDLVEQLIRNKGRIPEADPGK